MQKVINSNEETSESVGLINIRKRLDILYGTSLNIESKIDEGTRVSLLLPKRKDMKNESNIDR